MSSKIKIITININDKNEILILFEKFIKKAEKMNIEDNFHIRFDNHRDIIDEKTSIIYKVCDVIIEYTILKYDGWSFVAVIENNSHSENIFKKLPYMDDIEIPEKYKNTKANLCEHCNIERYRRKTFIVMKNDEFKQVGSTCLKDFIGIDIIKILSIYDIFNKIFIHMSSLKYDNRKNDNYSKFFTSYDNKFVLARAIVTIKKYGYVSNKTAESMLCSSTSDIIKEDLVSNNNDRSVKTEDITKDDIDKAVKIINFFKEDFQNCPDKYIDNFWYTIKVILNDEFVKYKEIAYVTALPYIYDKRMESVYEKNISNYIGNVNDTISDYKVILNKCSTVDSFYGLSKILKFVDENGNILIWKTSSRHDFKVNHEYKIKFKIKSHSTYHEVKQTDIIRVKEC